MNDKVLRITEYTDPLCIWCYAIEPTWRKLEYLAEIKSEFHNVLGLMLEDSHVATGYGPDSDAKFKQMLDYLRMEHSQATSRGDLPYSSKHFDNMPQRYMTSLPQSLAFEAMKLQDEKQANLFMRRLREAYHSDDLPPSDDILFDLAKEYDIDDEKFQKDYKDGTARKMLDQDIVLCGQAGVQGFPTVVLEYDDKRIGFSGYITFDRLKAAIDELTGGNFKYRTVEFTEDSVIEFVRSYGRVAFGEVKLIFDVSDEEAREMVDKLVNEGKISKEVRESSFFVRTL